MSAVMVLKGLYRMLFTLNRSSLCLSFYLVNYFALVLSCSCPSCSQGLLHPRAVCCDNTLDEMLLLHVVKQTIGWKRLSWQCCCSFLSGKIILKYQNEILLIALRSYELNYPKNSYKLTNMTPFFENRLTSIMVLYRADSRLSFNLCSVTWLS